MKQESLVRHMILAALAMAPLAAQTNPVFSPRRMKDYNEQSRDGRCVLRVRVDDEIDVELRGNSVLLRTITGRPGKDEGSECSQPLPAGGFTKFTFRGIDGRGEVRLVQEPFAVKRGYWLVAPTPQWRQAKVKALVEALTS